MADPGPAYQLRRYGWSAKVALSVLTDFDELGVYDCTLRPRPGDKAGGVYYTPSYIVDYIVKNTVGKQVKGKSPAQLAGGKREPPFRVLDMACGSGSFLLGAYQCLLNHCLDWFLENKPESHK